MSRHLNRKGKALLGAIAATAMLMIPTVAVAKDAIGSRIEIEKIDGSAFVIDDKGNKADARTGVKLSSGQSLQTTEDSYIYLSLDDSKVIELDELSEVKVNKKGKKLKLEVEEGSLFFEVKEKLADDESMNIDASTMSMSIRGTAGVVSLRRVDGKVISAVDLLEGRVDMVYSDVNGENHEFTLWGGESSEHVDGENEVKRDLIDITEFAGFAAKALENDPELAAKILEKSGLNSDYAIKHSDELLKESHTYNMEKYAGVFEEGNVNAVHKGGIKYGPDNEITVSDISTETVETTAENVISTGEVPAVPAVAVTTIVTPKDDGNTGNAGGGNSNDGGGSSGGNDGNSDGGQGDSGGNSGGGQNDGGSSGGDSGSSSIVEWIVKFFGWDNELISSQTVQNGVSANAPAAPTHEGYTFNGWDGDYTNVTSNRDIFATWIKKNQYTVKFLLQNTETGNYDLVATEYVNEGQDATEPVVEQTKEGFKIEWMSSLKNITEDVDIYGEWVADGVEKYTVTFEDGYGNIIETEEVAAGGSASPPENPTKEGYTFTGWDGNYTNVTSDQTVYAIWEENSGYTQYTVTFTYSDYSRSYKVDEGASAAEYASEAIAEIRALYSEVTDTYSWNNDGSESTISNIVSDVTFTLGAM